MDRFNPLSPEVLSDPYPHYAWLRRHDPVHWGAPGDPQAAGCWYITRYEDVVAVLKDQRFGREVWRVLPAEAQPPISEAHQAIVDISRQWMVLRDPPGHTRLRTLVQRVFTPRMIERLTPQMAGIVNEVLDHVQPQGRMNVAADFGLPLAVIVIAELLGVPPADRPLFLPWTAALAAVIEFKQTDNTQAQANQAITELNDYLRDIIAQRRRHPREDLISALIHSEADGDKISEAEFLGTCTQLLFGGNDPVAHMIGNGLLALFHHPDQLERWRANPALTDTAIDELMRYDSSVQMTFRYALEDMTFNGRFMRQGELVALVLGSANRDATQFSQPDQLDLARTPNRHMSLGVGIHYCLGAALSRAEGRVAFNTLLQRFPKLRLEATPLHWNETVAVRGLQRLPVTFE